MYYSKRRKNNSQSAQPKRNQTRHNKTRRNNSNTKSEQKVKSMEATRL